MSNGDGNPNGNPDPHAPGYGYGYGGEAHGQYPQDGWGGEYDADATAFVQLPAGLPGDGTGADPWGAPLAAPGTGQGGYTPPVLDPADAAGPAVTHMTPAATTDPGGAGQWAMPFGTDAPTPGAGPADGQGAGRPGSSYADQHADQYAQYHAQHPSPPRQGPSSPSGEPSAAAAMGQGAAAALAGSHEARTQRRPLGSGGGSAGAQTPGAGMPEAPVQGGYAEQHQDAAGEAQFADAHARRQVPFDGAGEHEPGSAAAEGDTGPGPYAMPHGAEEGGGYEGIGTVRSGLPWAPSPTGTATPEQAARPGESAPPDASVPPGDAGHAGDGAHTGYPEHFSQREQIVESGLPSVPSVPSGGDSGTGGQWTSDHGAPVPGSGWGDAFALRTHTAPETAPETAPGTDVPQDPSPVEHLGAGTAERAQDAGPGAESGPGSDTAAAPGPGPLPGHDTAPQDSPASAPGPTADQESAAAERAPEAGTPGEAPAAEVPSDDVPPGDLTSGEAASGEAASGEVPPNGLISAEPPLELAPEFGGEHPHISYVLRVNGTDRPVTDAWIGESLLYVLRERLGLAGAKDGCAQGECGACSVQVDGRLVASCLVPAATAAGTEIRTVEGLAVDGTPSDVQRALTESGAVQCGFCVPGLAMTVHDLLEGNHAPSELETRQAICGNLCRCSGYRGVLDAVRTVVSERAAKSARDTGEPDENAPHARIPHQAGPGAGSVQAPEGGGV